MDGGPNQSIYNINNTIGVATVVYCGYDALPIPQAIINHLRVMTDEQGEIPTEQDKPSRFPGRVGDRVKFKESSPLFGFIAEIKRVDTGGRLVLELDQMLGVAREVAAHQSDVGEILR